jgi:hypothetical protein
MKKSKLNQFPITIDKPEPIDTTIRDKDGNVVAFATKRAVADSTCMTVPEEQRKKNVKRFQRYKETGSNFCLPQELSLTKVLREQLLKLDYDSGRVHVNKIVSRLIELAESGSIAAIEAIMNRVDGKVIEKHEIENKNPITLVFRPAGSVESSQVQLTGGCPNPTEQLIIEGSSKEIDD